MNIALQAFKNKMKLYRVVAPHFVAGFVVHGELVIKAAPIIRYLIGKRCCDAIEYLTGKGWTVADVDPDGKAEPVKRVTRSI